MRETPDRPRPFLPPMPTGNGRVRIISPAGPVIDQNAFTAGCDILRRAGIEVEIPESRRSGYLAGSDHERVQELMAAVSDPDTGSVFAARGGYGCQRLLPLLNPEIFRNNPRIICGASDVSILLNLIAVRTGLITFHTPMAIKLARVDRTSRESTVALLKGSLPPPPPPLVAFRDGTAQGRLLGGNLTVLTHLSGTPYAIPFAGAVVFLEDINEPLYRIDRMFQQLRQSGALADVAAVVLGDFLFNGEIIDPAAVATLAAEATDNECAILTGLACGHGKRNLPLPVGCECEINNDRLSFIYPVP